jgi:hypothetical protein
MGYGLTFVHYSISSNRRSKGISNIPIRFRIADVLNGDDQTNYFYLASYDNQSRYTPIQIIRRLQKRQIAWQPWLRPALGDDNFHLERTEDLLANCNHWTTKFTDKTTQIDINKLSDLRQTWNKQDYWIRNAPHPPTGIPPAWHLNTKQWRLFWSLPLLTAW